MQDLGTTDVPKWFDIHFKYRHHCPQEGLIWLWEEVRHKKHKIVQSGVNHANWSPISPQPTGANTMDPNPGVCRELGPQGSLGLWLQRIEMGKGKRRLEEEEEGKEEAAARSEKVRGSRKGKKGGKGSVPSWDPMLQGSPHRAPGSFLLWECYQDLKRHLKKQT